LVEPANGRNRRKLAVGRGIGEGPLATLSGPHWSRREPADLPLRHACDRLRSRSQASRPAGPL